MSVVNNEDIKKFLQDKDIQGRVRQRMLEARSRATVTISVAATVSGFTESQLREWDKKGYLQTDRTTPATEGKGHRQYTPQDLDKLMLIRELVNSGYGLSDVLQTINVIWKQITEASLSEPAPAPIRGQDIPPSSEAEARHYPIDKRVDQADEDNFWRYFVSQALRLSLLLITEDAPGTIAGLILPLESREPTQRITSPFDTAQAGPSLVGWLGPNQTVYTSYESFPTFEYPSDFRIEYLPEWSANTCPSPLIILQRRARTPLFSEALVQTIQRLFDLVYRHVKEWQPYFGYGMRDRIDPVTNFWLNQTITDLLLDRLMNIIIDLGGEEHGLKRWKFCGLFLPQDRNLPLQQRTLSIRSASRDAPGSVVSVMLTTSNPGSPSTTPSSTSGRVNSVVLTASNPGLTYRAYLSGQVIYRPHLVARDAILANREFEESVRSAIALPVISADGMAAGAIYVASEYTDAFPLPDQRALRLMTKMLEELLATYQARVYVGGKLSETITRPRIVDSSFAEFYSEEDFLNELEQLLTHILHEQDEERLQGKEVSFICIDIDKQSPLAIKYGDRAARNLSREVGLLLQGQMLVQSNPDYRKVFHIGADQYNLRLVDMSLEDTQNLARQLRRLLRGDYRVDVRREGKPISREEKLPLSGVTVKMGISNYKFWKLKQVLKRYPATHAVADTRKLVLDNLDQSLAVASAEGGDCIITWDHNLWGYRVLERGEPQGS